MHRTSVKSYRIDIDQDICLLEYSLYYSATKEKLLSDKSFKKLVLDETPDEVSLFLDRDDVRQRLVIQNRQLIKLSKRYVTNQVRDT